MRKVTRTGKKDYRVTVRLDAETYRSLSEAVEQGAISNLSEALRSMIRQKLWEQRFSKEIPLDVKWSEVSKKELRSMANRMFGDLGVSEYRKFLTADGFIEGIFSALGGVVKKGLVELERREQKGRVTRSKRPGTNERGN
ncbi:MAG TPA: ribbon-helix-helix protein, CopG family [Dehalococcoidia bacterium]|nr:ribbon-helix-helix protein, CopG family [Dehalococcoidia bacterium]